MGTEHWVKFSLYLCKPLNYLNKRPGSLATPQDMRVHYECWSATSVARRLTPRSFIIHFGVNLEGKNILLAIYSFVQRIARTNNLLYTKPRKKSEAIRRPLWHLKTLWIFALCLRARHWMKFNLVYETWREINDLALKCFEWQFAGSAHFWGMAGDACVSDPFGRRPTPCGTAAPLHSAPSGSL